MVLMVHGLEALWVFSILHQIVQAWMDRERPGSLHWDARSGMPGLRGLLQSRSLHRCQSNWQGEALCRAGALLD